MLKHTALYTKNWYQKSNNIWDDIIKCITADGYMPMNCQLEDTLAKEDYEQAASYLEQAKDNILTILINNVAKLIPNDKEYLLHQLIEAMDKRNCWKFGYYHNEFWCKENFSKNQQELLEPYNQKTAILYFFLSHLQMAEVKDLWGDSEIPKPDRNVLPIREGFKIKNRIKNKT